MFNRVDSCCRRHRRHRRRRRHTNWIVCHLNGATVWNNFRRKYSSFFLPSISSTTREIQFTKWMKTMNLGTRFQRQKKEKKNDRENTEKKYRTEFHCEFTNDVIHGIIYWLVIPKKKTTHHLSGSTNNLQYKTMREHKIKWRSFSWMFTEWTENRFERIVDKLFATQTNSERKRKVSIFKLYWSIL